MIFEFEQGEKYFIKTFGDNFTGRVVRVTSTTVVITDAAWIADTGRFHLFMRGERTPQLEVEPYPDGMELPIPLAYISLPVKWPYELFREPI